MNCVIRCQCFSASTLFGAARYANDWLPSTTMVYPVTQLASNFGDFIRPQGQRWLIRSAARLGLQLRVDMFFVVNSALRDLALRLLQAGQRLVEFRKRLCSSRFFLQQPCRGQL